VCGWIRPDGAGVCEAQAAKRHSRARHSGYGYSTWPMLGSGGSHVHCRHADCVWLYAFVVPSHFSIETKSPCLCNAVAFCSSEIPSIGQAIGAGDLQVLSATNTPDIVPISPIKAASQCDPGREKRSRSMS